MIAILIALTLAALFLFLAWACFKNPRNPALSRSLALAFVATAAITVASGLSLYPLASRWQATNAAETALAKAKGEADAIRALSDALGGPQAYLEYLKVQKED